MLKLLLCCILATLPPQLAADGGPHTYTNPVTDFPWPDPTVWTDGIQYYSVATGIRQVMASTDLHDWGGTGVRPSEDMRRLRSMAKNFWAPDVAKVGDSWKMYLTLYNSAEDSAIGVFDSPEAGGPFTFVRKLTRSVDTGIKDTIDPELVHDPSSGENWLFFGSIGGIHRVRLDARGENVTGSYEHVAGLTIEQDYTRSKVFEGSYLHWHDGFWYLFASSGNYWDHTYRIVVGRSPSLDGEFLDKEGRRMAEGYASTVMHSDRGDRFFGPGHNGEIITDDAGQDYIFYHCHDIKISPDARQLYLQRIFWAEDGWPYVEGGKPVETDIAPTLSLRGKPRPESKEARLAPGQTLALPDCHVRKNCELSARVNSFNGAGAVTLGRGGRDVYWGAWVKVTPDSAFVYERDYFDDAEQIVLFDAFAHGLRFGRGMEIKVTTSLPDSTGVLSISSAGREFKHKIHWRGGGVPYLTNDGDNDVYARLGFYRGDACQDVWFIADSYFMEYDIERWPYYMVAEGHLDWMADHLPGGGSAEFLECFRNDLRYGKPKYAVWMMGMNDFNDEDGKPAPAWMSATEGFLSLCSEHDITPVLVTIPTVPERCHDFKTRWIRESGYRYIDWYDAVGAKPWDGGRKDRRCMRKTGKHRGWDKDYLYQDGVHPSESGASVLWKQVKEDLPEIIM